MRNLVLICLSAAALLAQTAVYSGTRPNVIVPGVTQNVVVELRVSGTVPTKVVFEQTLIAGPDLEMKDDGTGGDLVAGDRVYSVTLPVAPIVAATKPEAVFRPALGFFRLMQGATVVSRSGFKL